MRRKDFKRHQRNQQKKIDRKQTLKRTDEEDGQEVNTKGNKGCGRIVHLA